MHHAWSWPSSASLLDQVGDLRPEVPQTGADHEDPPERREDAQDEGDETDEGSDDDDGGDDRDDVRQDLVVSRQLFDLVVPFLERTTDDLNARHAFPLVVCD